MIQFQCHARQKRPGREVPWPLQETHLSPVGTTQQAIPEAETSRVLQIRRPDEEPSLGDVVFSTVIGA
jgi:hypothetical protein